MMERKTIDLWVGIFMLMGVGALLWLSLRVGDLGEDRPSSTYAVEAKFSNIGGLKAKAPVKSAGVLVGRVSDIKFDNDRFQASVELTLDKRYSFPKDTSASILTSGLLGEVYIGLDPGWRREKIERRRQNIADPVGSGAGAPDWAIHVRQGCRGRCAGSEKIVVSMTRIRR